MATKQQVRLLERELATALADLTVVDPRLNTHAKVTQAGCAEITHHAYGMTINSHEQEWAISILYNTRQDGLSCWQVALIECDGALYTRHGCNRTNNLHKVLQRALHQVTVEASWLTPINADTE